MADGRGHYRVAGLVKSRADPARLRDTPPRPAAAFTPFFTKRPRKANDDAIFRETATVHWLIHFSAASAVTLHRTTSCVCVPTVGTRPIAVIELSRESITPAFHTS